MKANIQKIDKFYLAFILILIILSTLLIITFKSIFSAYISAYEVKPEDVATKIKVDNKLLDEAYAWVTKK